MSCQQATRLITTAPTITNKTKIREDPYVFTDAFSAAPPILFNGQKPRAKEQDNILNTSVILTKTSVAKIAKPGNKKLPLTQINGFATKSVASVVVSSATSTPSNEQAKKIVIPNASISRTNQQHQQNQALHETIHLTSLPTPSLWQTPLLLETIVSPPTSPASLPSPSDPDQSAKLKAEATSPPPPSPAPTLTSIISATVKPSASLPPSNFHHTTFAQHLQKVGCIRKTHPPANIATKKHINNNSTSVSVSTAPTLAVTPIQTSKNSSPSFELHSHHQQHSDNELNEIPVNVIYRKLPLVEDTPIQSSPEKPQNVDPMTVALAVRQKHLQQSELENVKTKATKSSISVDKPLHLSEDCTILKSICKTTGPAKKAEKCLQTDSFISSPKKTDKKRKTLTPEILKQKPLEIRRDNAKNEKCTAFAVVTCPVSSGINSWSTIADTEEGPPYLRQHHWLWIYEGKERSNGFPTFGRSTTREEKIDEHKNLLRRQAMQLLSMRKLLQYPLQTARRRLICVDRLLRKHEDHREVDYSAKTCLIEQCHNQALPMATHCYAHIGHNVDQQLFLTCTAKFADNSQCRIPVFDIVHDLPLCEEHARKRDAYNRTWQEHHTARKVLTVSGGAVHSMQRQENEFGQPLHQRPQQLHQQKMLVKFVPTKAANSTKPTLQRINKRKSGSSATALGAIKPVGRPQKRYKKSTSVGTSINVCKPSTAPPRLSAVKQRKSSNTSLESITSNSHSSHSQPAFVHAAISHTALAPPALAPLSGTCKRFQQQHLQHKQNQQIPDYSGGFGGVIGVPSTVTTSTAVSCGGDVSRMLELTNCSSGSHEINHLSTIPFTAHDSNNNNSNSHTDFSSGLSLPSADEILTQDMLSICENSSVYASSEDTGVGGLSETELFAGAHDTEEIPLGDTRLLEEHDLTNVLNTLPVDAFNELFTAVRQDERDEVERALEIADKHLKSLQQTIGSDSDFLGDFLNASDHMLDDSDICNKMGIISSVLHSPDPSGLDSGTLFGGIAGSVTGSTSGNSSTVTSTDSLGLVQT